LEPVDIVAVTRHNKTLQMGNYRKAAEEGNFFLRGFNYLFIMRKKAESPGGREDAKGGSAT
jgi:adenine-specific DNA-methyltransferase